MEEMDRIGEGVSNKEEHTGQTECQMHFLTSSLVIIAEERKVKKIPRHLIWGSTDPKEVLLINLSGVISLTRGQSGEVNI